MSTAGVTGSIKACRSVRCGSPAVISSIGALYSLFASLPEAVAWLERLHTIAPCYGVRGHGPPDTRWLFLGLCMKALGQLEQAARLRELARELHPHGQARDALFDRVSVRDNRVAVPRFDAV